jgi:hypothetical protein
MAELCWGMMSGSTVAEDAALNMLPSLMPAAVEIAGLALSPCKPCRDSSKGSQALQGSKEGVHEAVLAAQDCMPCELELSRKGDAQWGWMRPDTGVENSSDVSARSIRCIRRRLWFRYSCSVEEIRGSLQYTFRATTPLPHTALVWTCMSLADPDTCWHTKHDASPIICVLILMNTI